jgi:threonine/homoserine/homoserine lactone efflux protein
MSVEFLLTSLIVVVAPGTGVLYTVATGLRQGRRASVVAASGCTLGILPHMLAAITGLATLLQASAAAFETIKYLGVAYLLWMAWQALRHKNALRLETDDGEDSSTRLIVSAILLNLLNPKLPIFFLAFLPQFIAAGAPHPVLDMTRLSLIFMAMTWVVFVGYGVFAAAMRRHVLSRPRVLTWLRGAFATAFITLGIKLAFAQR